MTETLLFAQWLSGFAAAVRSGSGFRPRGTVHRGRDLA